MMNVVRQFSSTAQFSKRFDGNVYSQIDKIITNKLQGKKIDMKTDYIDLAVHRYQIQELDMTSFVEVRVEDPWNTYMSSDNNSLVEKVTELLGEADS